jgi:hypothetical protein
MTTATATTSEPRTLTTAKGRTVTTTLTDNEAVAGLASLDNDFARDLSEKARKYGLSRDQMTWAHILVVESRKPAVPVVELDFNGIADVFDHAKDHLQHPKIRLAAGDQKVVLSVAGLRSRTPGAIQVTDGGPYGSNRYFGRIETTGIFVRGRDCSDAIVDLLKEFAADPAKVAAAYGHTTGACCFCGIELTDDRSLMMGYGPICAGNYGLAYPSKKEAAEYMKAKTA